ncbi:MAG: hypothetical protein U9R49_03905 [Bacteroidota bacterium]|nr:hypothetical protein [Bacteroidota bacterium]
MSYVDLIIKYLSGDLSQEESVSFEKELESNHELKETFEQHRAAFELIRDQLQKRDDQTFRAKLQEAMSHDTPAPAFQKTPSRNWWYIPPAVACVLAMMLILLPLRPGNEKILSRFFHPAEDPVVLAYNQDTRGEPEPGIIQYRLGKYQDAMELLSVRINQEKDNKLILLYYLLSAMELDRQQEVLALIPEEEAERMDLLDQTISWYTSLALIKSDRREDALEKLQPLTEQEGSYHSDALKLEKVLLK